MRRGREKQENGWLRSKEKGREWKREERMRKMKGKKFKREKKKSEKVV